MTIIELSCEEVWHELSELLDGTLGQAMRDRLELHLRHCAHCRAVYDGTRNMVELLGDEQVLDLPAGFSERLLKRLAVDLCG